MTSILGAELRSRLSEFVTSRLGIRFAPDRWDDLERGALAAAAELGSIDPVRWVLQLLNGVLTFTQQQTLANQLTVGETYFFRQTEVFTGLEQKVLPELIRARRAKRELRVWSAGCSTGEEPYSIAILLHRLLPDFAGWKIVIAGTDLSTQSLSKAAKGIYTNWSFRDTPSWVKTHYFTATGGKQYAIHSNIRESVRFSYLNLAEQGYPSFLGGTSCFDLILCRNVLMYFSPKWQDEILSRLGNHLAPDGLLLLGPCDVPSRLHQEFTAVDFPPPGCYRKRVGRSREETLFVPTLRPDLPWKEAGPGFSAFAPSSAHPSLARETRVPRDASVPPAEAAGAGSIWLARVHQLVSAGQRSEAIELCTQAIEAEKLDPRLRLLRACLFQESGEEAKAAKDYRAILYLDPEHIMAHLALAAIARNHQRRALALRHYRQASRGLKRRPRGEIIEGSDGLTAGRIHDMVTELLSTAHE